MHELPDGCGASSMGTWRGHIVQGREESSLGTDPASALGTLGGRPRLRTFVASPVRLKRM